VRAWLDAILAVTLAPACAVCAAALPHPTNGPVCADCWRSVRLLTPPLCMRCGDPLLTWRAGTPDACARCRGDVRAFDRAAAIGPYDGALREIIHALKYQGRRSLARPLARLLRAQAAGLIADAVAAVPVPLHPARLRSRGFNQADDLARGLPLPVVAALRRHRATDDQVTLPAAERHRNVRGAFVATRHAGVLRGGIVVLVDDVSTTGATLDACARALKEAGVREVRALTAARVLTAPR
jgi:ComF family protein